MKCERCQKNPARVRVDQMVDGRHVSHFLCQSCIDELMSTVGQASVFNGQGTSSANAPFGSSPHSALLKQGTQFLTALAEWEQTLASITWHDLASEATQGHVALFCVDMVNGFCHAGMLASPRIEAIIPEVVAVFRGAYSIGVRNFILAQDCHTPDSVEFAAFPPHCQAGTSEAENIPELADLPFANLYTTVEKNSLNAFHGTKLTVWIEEHPDLSTAIVVGNCTDLCVYQMAMHLKLDANARNHPLRVIVPASAVQTYDMPVDVAKEIGVLPHDGDVLHLLFLHHMRINGVEVVHAIV